MRAPPSGAAAETLGQALTSAVACGPARLAPSISARSGLPCKKPTASRAARDAVTLST
jgi:hypothetical protein